LILARVNFGARGWNPQFSLWGSSFVKGSLLLAGWQINCRRHKFRNLKVKYFSQEVKVLKKENKGNETLFTQDTVNLQKMDDTKLVIDYELA
jgi:hypothetical protein